VAVEASASGLPVIASNVGGIPEVVEDGRTGILIPPGDVESLARAIRYSAENPWRLRDMGREARRKMERLFDAGRFGQAMVRLYERSMAEPLT